MSKTILIVIVMLSLLGCSKKEQEDPKEGQARRDSATTICLDQAKQWCDRVKGIVTQQFDQWEKICAKVLPYLEWLDEREK